MLTHQLTILVPWQDAARILTEEQVQVFQSEYHTRLKPAANDIKYNNMFGEWGYIETLFKMVVVIGEIRTSVFFQSINWRD
jgi:hypothetical protein